MYSTKGYNDKEKYEWNYYHVKTYGISQDPDTKDYLIVLQNIYCKQCGVVNIQNEWCKMCQIKDLNIINWTSGNEIIDYYIQELQLEYFSNENNGEYRVLVFKYFYFVI